MLTRFMKARYVLHSSTLGQLSRLRLKMLRTSGELTAMASSAYAFQCSACMHLHDIDDGDCAARNIAHIFSNARSAQATQAQMQDTGLHECNFEMTCCA